MLRAGVGGPGSDVEVDAFPLHRIDLEPPYEGGRDLPEVGREAAPCAEEVLAVGGGPSGEETDEISGSWVLVAVGEVDREAGGNFHGERLELLCGCRAGEDVNGDGSPPVHCQCGRRSLVPREKWDGVHGERVDFYHNAVLREAHVVWREFAPFQPMSCGGDATEGKVGAVPLGEGDLHALRVRELTPVPPDEAPRLRAQSRVSRVSSPAEKAGQEGLGYVVRR
mmetsp:Transcript_51431/g.70056  ORF Transcript_51431/g.70056 Transcript_51431/m.70056 type:complete len:224 (+) Transcript_51431:589-1260(+)